jgi:hypothetical protein
MKDLHPHFHFHTGDWLTRHFLITHCQVMSKSLKGLYNDPERALYQRYMDKENQDKMEEANQASSAPSNTHLALPAQKVSVLCFAVNTLMP